MKVGIFWLGDIDSSITEFCSTIFKKNQDFSFSFFANKVDNFCNPIKKNETSYKYNEINELCNVYDSALSADLDFVLINYGSSFPIYPPAIIDLLSEIEKKKAIWSFRLSNISGEWLRHSPRLPYIDENFIILNVNEAKKKAFFDRKLINSIHFYDTAGISSVLQSMFEYSLKYEEHSNHYFEGSGKDQYGKSSKLTSYPFFLCEKYLYMTCYPQYSPRFKKLLLTNLDILSSKSINHLGKISIKENLYYLTKIFDTSIIFQFVKNYFRPKHFDFKKSYEKDT